LSRLLSFLVFPLPASKARHSVDRPGPGFVAVC
jgi:hypothetical protein